MGLEDVPVSANFRRTASEGFAATRWRVVAEEFDGSTGVLVVGDGASVGEVVELNPQLFARESSRADRVLALSHDATTVALALQASARLGRSEIWLLVAAPSPKPDQDVLSQLRSWLRAAGLVTVRARRILWASPHESESCSRWERLDRDTCEVLVMAVPSASPAAVTLLEDELVLIARQWAALSERQLEYARTRSADATRARRIAELEERVRQLEEEIRGRDAAAGVAT